MQRVGRTALWGFIGVVACVWSVAGWQAGGGVRAAGAASLADLRALIEAGRYVEAEEAGLKLAADPAGDGAVEIAEAIDLVLEARWLGRRLTQPRTVEIGERALAIKEAAFGADDGRVATTLVLLGLARSAHRDGEGARTAAIRAIAIRERTLGADHLDVAAALNALAWIERIASRFDGSAAAARRALDIARRAEQPAARETAAALTSLGHFQRQIGRADLAIPLFGEALAIDERRYGLDHPALVSSIQPLAYAYWDTGDADKTRSLRERMVRLLSAPGSEYRLGFELVLLSGWLETAGDYPAALSVAERAVQVAERATSPTSPLSASALEQQAQAYSSLNDHAAAAAIRRRTVALWSAAQGEGGIHTATAWKQLADTYEEAGDIDAGLDAVERALAVPALTKEAIPYPEALQTKARLLMARGRLADARAILELARQVGENGGTYAQVVADLGTTYRLLARIERQDGHPARAVPLYREGLRLYEGSLGAANPTVASWRTELATALAEVGDLAEARLALKSGEQQSLDHLRLVARTLTDRAALKFAASRLSGVDLAVTLAADRRVRVRGDIDTAWDMVIHGRTVVLDEMAARQRAVTEEAGNADLRDRWTTLNRTRARLANLIIRGPADQPSDAYQALVDRTRADRDRAERDLAEASVAFRHEQQRSHAGLHEVMATLPADAVVISYVRYTPQPVMAAASARPTRAQAVAGGSSDAQAGGATRVGASAADSASRTTRSGPSPDRATSAQGMSALPTTPAPTRGAGNADALKDVMPPTGAAYAAFIARAGSPVAIVPLGPAERIEAAIDAWRGRIRDELSSAGLASRRTEATYRQAGAALRALIWDPVYARLGASMSSPTSAPTVFVVPDGALHLVDLATLPTGQTRYLVDAPFVLHYLLAERDLLQPPPTTKSDTLLALGAPNFDKADRTVAAPPSWTIATAKARDANAARSAPTASACDASFAARFDPLPSTRDEIVRIAELWQRGIAAEASGAGSRTGTRVFEAAVLGGVRATETAFKSLARGRRVLHIATHGFFLDRFCAMTSAGAAAADRRSSSTTSTSGQRALEENPLLRSGLVLAGANRRASAAAARTDAGGDAVGADDDDGILTAEEIAGLDLSDAQWAVLSACDTGRGDWQAGEGVLGLRRAFEVAGAHTVILSLWPVLDTVTSTWMTELYRDKFVDGRTTAAAVRAANRTLLAARRANGESTHPLYWSGFIATGDWR